MTFRLRDYQRNLLVETSEALKSARSVCVVSPTGSGKTHTFVKMCKDLVHHGKSAVILSHRGYLIDQISQALQLQGVRHGIIVPKQPRTNDLIQVASVFSFAKRLGEYFPPDAVIVDECHHGLASTWMQVLQWSKSRSKVIGVTATPCRTDGKGLGEIYQEMVYGPTEKYLMETINPDTGMTFLSPARGLEPPNVADFSSLKVKSFGDYSKDELVEVTDRPEVTGDAVKHYMKYADGLPALAFCVTIDHAKKVAQAFRDAGVPSEAIYARGMSDSRRKELIQMLGDGRVKVLVSCELINEGFDVPVVAVAILLRKTASLGLHRQQVGRVLRPYKGKEYALIIDHVGNIRRHGMPDEEILWTLEGETKKEKKEREETERLKRCGECFMLFTPAPVCPYCGHESKVEREIRVDVNTELVWVDKEARKAQETKEKEERKRFIKEAGKEAKTLSQKYAWAKAVQYSAGKAENDWSYKFQHDPVLSHHQCKKLVQIVKNSPLIHIQTDMLAVADVEYLLAWQLKRVSRRFTLDDVRKLKRFQQSATTRILTALNLLMFCGFGKNIGNDTIEFSLTEEVA